MPHPDDTFLLFVGGSTAYDYLRAHAGIPTATAYDCLRADPDTTHPEWCACNAWQHDLAGAVAHVVHEAQAYQRRLTAAKLRRLLADEDPLIVLTRVLELADLLESD